MSDPVPPTNARWEGPHGAVVPLELVFGGFTDDGCASWVATVPVRVTPEWHLCVDALPARTEIVVAAPGWRADA